MAIIGKTFDYQRVSAGDDGALYRMLSGGTDMIAPVGAGTLLSISANTLTIAECYVVIGGRFMRVAGGTTISLGTITSSHTKGRVILRLDMTELANVNQLQQIETEVETTSGSFRSLVQNNINSISGQTSNVYEAVLCTFTCSSGTASSPVSALSSAVSYPLAIAKGGTGATTSAQAIANLGAVGQYFNSSATDLDTIFTAGIYRLQTGVTNYPSGATSNYSTLIVFRGTSSSDTVTQIFSSYNDDNLWYRKVRGVTSTPTFGSWVKWTGFKDITKVTYTNEALTGLQAKRLPFSSQDVIQGYGFVTATANADHITLPAGVYRFETHFATTVGADGFIKSCLKVGSTSTTFIMTDKLYAGAGAGSSSTILGANASDVLVLTASTDIYFLVMSSANTSGTNATLTIERLN